MKRLFLTLFAVGAALFAVSQEEIAVEQIISGKIEKLEIEAGWKVKVLNQVADTCCSIAIVTTEEYLEKASQTKLCKLSGKTLTILENNTLQATSTRVEIEALWLSDYWRVGQWIYESRN